MGPYAVEAVAPDAPRAAAAAGAVADAGALDGLPAARLTTAVAPAAAVCVMNWT